MWGVRPKPLIIGEASRNLDRYHPQFTSENEDVPWSDIYWMRNRVAHCYFSVDLELVWKTIEKDIPKLQKQIQEIFERLSKKE